MEKSTHNLENQHKNTGRRIGFRYFPDSHHYSQNDLQTWLPELRDLKAGWLVLETPSERAIPEDFLRTIIAAGIQPILQMQLPLSRPADSKTIIMLISTYASWGVKYIVPFDKPNTRQAWGADSWVQQKLVDRFLDRFIPLADKICELGMTPVFPALQPGGHYWDTVFLRSSLQKIKERGYSRLLDNMVLGAYAWPGDQPLDWGTGGPQAWPDVHPYDTPDDQQDHLGFRIHEWYSAVAETVLGKTLPVILLGTGADQIENASDDDTNLTIAQMLADPEKIPGNVLAGCFPLVSASAEHPASKQAWFTPDGGQQPVVSRLREWLQSLLPEDDSQPGDLDVAHPSISLNNKLIKHYLLLPHPKWGNPDWFIKVTRPFIKKYAPTTGYSMKEAFYAQRVTIIGGVQVFPEDIKHQLEQTGCQVVQIYGSGTEIATILAEL